MQISSVQHFSAALPVRPATRRCYPRLSRPHDSRRIINMKMGLGTTENGITPLKDGSTTSIQGSTSVPSDALAAIWKHQSSSHTLDAASISTDSTFSKIMVRQNITMTASIRSISTVRPRALSRSLLSEIWTKVTSSYRILSSHG